MIYVLFAVGLNLSGVFSFGERIAGGRRVWHHARLTLARFSPVRWRRWLLRLVLRPSWRRRSAMRSPSPGTASFAIFEAIGFGMALPYLGSPSAPARAFPAKARIWMLRLKQFLAFPIYGTAVWLPFVLAQESGGLGVTAALAGLVLIAFAAWLYEACDIAAAAGGAGALAISALSLIGALALVLASRAPASAPHRGDRERAGIGWLPFSPAKVDELQAQGRPVFVDFTADWCITCKINERVALADPPSSKRSRPTRSRRCAPTGRGRIPRSRVCWRPTAARACRFICSIRSPVRGESVAGRSSCRKF